MIIQTSDMKKILILGGAGYLGTAITPYFLQQKYNVICVDDEYLTENWVSNLFNILNQNFDCIFHVGACSDTLETDVNYMMLRNYETTKYISDYCFKKFMEAAQQENYFHNTIFVCRVVPRI